MKPSKGKDEALVCPKCGPRHCIKYVREIPYCAKCGRQLTVYLVWHRGWFVACLPAATRIMEAL